MKLSATLSLRHLLNNKKRTLWTLFSIALAVGMLVSIAGYGLSSIETLNLVAHEFGEDLVQGIELISGGIAIIIGIIVAITSIIVISNTFRVSSLERTKQFGILKSVGATKKQIRKTVIWEAIILSAIGIPIGVLTGFALHFLALTLSNSMVDISSIHEYIRFQFEINPLLLLFVTGISFLIILISSWLPARKAANTPAINAIKGTHETRKKEKAKKARLANKIFGFPGALASKQLKRSRRHFRATVLSICISIILILMSVSLSTHMNRSINGRVLQMNEPNAFIVLTAAPDKAATSLNAETLRTINNKLNTFPDTTVDAWGATFHSLTGDDSFIFNLISTVVVTNEWYVELLEIANKPYGSNLLINVHIEVDAQGNLNQYNPFDFIPNEVLTLYQQESQETRGFAETPWELTLHGEVRYLPPHMITLSESMKIIVVPDGEMSAAQWTARTLDPEGFVTFAKDTIPLLYELSYGEEIIDMNFAEMLSFILIIIESALVFVRIFSFMLIFLGLTNVISTITTNIKLRAKDFAVLTSIGMDKKSLRKMIALESLMSSFRALVFGLPLGFGAAYLVYLVADMANVLSIVFTPPWFAIAICAIGVFLITFVIMLFAANSLSKNNIVETIRGA